MRLRLRLLSCELGSRLHAHRDPLLQLLRFSFRLLLFDLILPVEVIHDHVPHTHYRGIRFLGKRLQREFKRLVDL